MRYIIHNPVVHSCVSGILPDIRFSGDQFDPAGIAKEQPEEYIPSRYNRRFPDAEAYASPTVTKTTDRDYSPDRAYHPPGRNSL